jgi:saccharopine dehydrogenase-like NADP-dependent oxidoreductase
MKVLLLGGTGVAGKGAASLFVRENLITEIGVASRHIEAAQRTAAAIGEKARGVCADIKDPHKLASIASEYDIIVNTAGPTSEVQIAAIQAALEAGVHYCDLGINGRPAEKALGLDAQARAKGVTAIIGTGWCAVTGLMAVHASQQLEKVEELFTCMVFDYSPGGFFSPDTFLARAHEKGYIETSGVDLIEGGQGPVWTYRKGHQIHIEPMEHPIEVDHPSGSRITAYPIDTVESVTLPRYLPGVDNLSTLFSIIPPQLTELFIQQSHRVAKGELDPARALVAFYEAALEDKERWLSSPPDYPTGWWMWAAAAGYKHDRKARYMCWPSFLLDWTNVPLVIVALSILRGEVSLHGVFPPEAYFELKPFLEEAAKYMREEDREKPLLNVRFDWLE